MIERGAFVKSVHGKHAAIVVIRQRVGGFKGGGKRWVPGSLE